MGCALDPCAMHRMDVGHGLAWACLQRQNKGGLAQENRNSVVWEAFGRERVGPSKRA